jgi:signal transduction histidine kinase
MLPLVESAVARWGARARLAGGSLMLRWKAGAAVVVGDQRGIAQALDNLIVNAIEHGGPAIVVEGQCRGNRLRVLVSDPGRGTRTRAVGTGRAGTIARLSGRRRRGHGLAVVRQVAAAHGGRFALSRSESGSLAVLELPLAAGRAEITA